MLFPIYLPRSDGLEVFLMLSLKPVFSLSSFTFIKRLFSSSSPFAITVVSSAYLRLLMFHLSILILPTWEQMLSFKPAFSLSYFTFIKRLFSSSLLSDIRVVSSAYLRLLIFLPMILILVCASSSPAFHKLHAA